MKRWRVIGVPPARWEFPDLVWEYRWRWMARFAMKYAGQRGEWPLPMCDWRLEDARESEH